MSVNRGPPVNELTMACHNPFLSKSFLNCWSASKKNAGRITNENPDTNNTTPCPNARFLPWIMRIVVAKIVRANSATHCQNVTPIAMPLSLKNYISNLKSRLVASPGLGEI